MKGSIHSVRQRDKELQCVVSIDYPRGYITTVSSVRHYHNGMEVGYTEKGHRVVRKTIHHAWIQSNSRSKDNG